LTLNNLIILSFIFTRFFKIYYLSPLRA